MVQAAAILALAASAVSAGRPIHYIQGAGHTSNTIEIVGGKEAEVGKHLYVTGLREEIDGDAYCGGSLISPTAVLTAAHCGVGDWIEYVSIGSHFLSGTKDGERLKVKKIVLHPKYDSKTQTFDYAILELAEPSKIAPVAVLLDDDASVASGELSMARGWGTTSSGGYQSEVLKEVGLKLWSNKDCQAAFDKLNDKDIPPVHATHICAGGVKGEDTCQGDSGGPLTVNKNGTATLVGLTSWGIGCAQAGLPGVYARVSQAKDFIAPYLPTKPAC